MAITSFPYAFGVGCAALARYRPRHVVDQGRYCGLKEEATAATQSISRQPLLPPAHIYIECHFSTSTFGAVLCRSTQVDNGPGRRGVGRLFVTRSRLFIYMSSLRLIGAYRHHDEELPIVDRPMTIYSAESPARDDDAATRHGIMPSGDTKGLCVPPIYGFLSTDLLAFRLMPSRVAAARVGDIGLVSHSSCAMLPGR